MYNILIPLRNCSVCAVGQIQRHQQCEGWAWLSHSLLHLPIKQLFWARIEKEPYKNVLQFPLYVLYFSFYGFVWRTVNLCFYNRAIKKYSKPLIFKPQTNRRSVFRADLASRFVLPTFPRAEEAVHLHTGARVGHAESGAGNQSLLWRAAVCGSDQTPAGPFARPLQQLNCLTWREKQKSSCFIVC